MATADKGTMTAYQEGFRCRPLFRPAEFAAYECYFMYDLDDSEHDRCLPLAVKEGLEEWVWCRQGHCKI